MEIRLGIVICKEGSIIDSTESFSSTNFSETYVLNLEQFELQT